MTNNKHIYVNILGDWTENESKLLFLYFYCFYHCFCPLKCNTLFSKKKYRKGIVERD